MHEYTNIHHCNFFISSIDKPVHCDINSIFNPWFNIFLDVSILALCSPSALPCCKPFSNPSAIPSSLPRFLAVAISLSLSFWYFCSSLTRYYYKITCALCCAFNCLLCCWTYCPVHLLISSSISFVHLASLYLHFLFHLDL